MTDWTTDRAADALLDAEARRADRGPLTDEWPDLDLRTAYEVQDRLVSRRVGAGEEVVGVKLGLTSRAEQQRMGVDAPLTAWLTDAMVLPAGEPVPLDELIHPRVEPEIVFVLGRRLRGPGVTAATALAAVESVHCGAEVIDSRYTDFRFALPDVVADNASAARVVLGSTGVPPAGLDLALEACLLQVDGEVVDSATGAAVQGNPAEALALAANALAERDLALEPGWLVFTGGMTDAVPVTSGKQITAEFTRLGSVTVTGS
ncbi:2-keto-4-pentenoate hydratase [Saccharopolyspora rosea]|uniref:2-keto-4-pentenoate hydratase n=1 Tax=Saccharopolyspora rosea TaxID=524884 RepID=A0ABW3FVF4_9PSEU|nr:fumarylacetoacetate hydrolase family protein [Saccharopolyspora rosea]